jgi:hypothetical protein
MASIEAYSTGLEVRQEHKGNNRKGKRVNNRAPKML